MENHDIIVFVGVDALYFGALVGIGATAGVSLAFGAVDVARLLIKRIAARKGTDT